MSMHTYVLGFAPPDEIWKKHKAVWDACVEAGVSVPKETVEFFGLEAPDHSGVAIRLDKRYEVCTPWNTDGQEGFTLNLKELKKSFPQITEVRFINSY